MRITQIMSGLVMGLVCTVSAQAIVHRSSDLGWKAGQDVTKPFAELFTAGTLKTGDELILDHRYRISGSHTLPDGFTLSARQGGGFDVTDAKASAKLLTLGHQTTLNNLTITYLNTPEMGGRAYRHGIDFFDKVGIGASGKRDILIKHCRLEGMISHHIGLSDCVRPTVIGCHVIGGFWAVTISGQDLHFRDCLFEKSCCDNIKGGADGALFENCVFQDTCRDGIDTTGGLNDAIVRNCTFRRLGCSGLDLKSHYNDGPGRPENVGILIETCLFTDIPNGVVFTTNDGARRSGGKDLLTAANIKQYAPHDIEINDCTFGHVEKPLRPSLFGKDMDERQYGYGVRYAQQGEHMRLFLVKDAHGIRYRNARIFGHRIMPFHKLSNGGSRHLSKEAADALAPLTAITGNILEKPATPPKPGDTSVAFACGPQALKDARRAPTGFID